MFLVYVNKDHGIYKRTNQVTRNENLEKATRGFVYNNLCYSYTYMANWNFEAFCWDISASIRLFNHYYKNKLITLIFMFIKFKKSKIKNCHFISSVIQKSKASLNRFWKTYRAHILCEEITLKSRAKYHELLMQFYHFLKIQLQTKSSRNCSFLFHFEW